MVDGQRVPPLTVKDVQDSVERGAEIIGFYADNADRQIYLKLICRNGDIATVWLDPARADDLMRHFERLLLGAETDPGAGSRTKTLSRQPAAYGEFRPDGPEAEE
jgi:hypothetical protein